MGDTTTFVLSKLDLRTLAAAQVAGALITGLPKNTPESAMNAMAETAVKVAQAIEEAVERSLKSPDLPEPPQKPAHRVHP